MRVLLVENRLADARQTMASLKTSRFVVDLTDTGEEALELARLYDYDAMVLALELADLDGCEVVRRLRRAQVTTPVLILSSVAQPQAKVKALTAGADDVLTKPFDEQELAARLQAVIRRSKGFAEPRLTVGPLTLNMRSQEAIVGTSPVHFTGKELALLELLTLRRGTVVTKDAMLSHLYGGMDEPEIKIIDVFICKMRRKLAEAGAADLISTVWGRGYMMRDMSQHVRPAAKPQQPGPYGAAAA